MRVNAPGKSHAGGPVSPRPVRRFRRLNLKRCTNRHAAIRRTDPRGESHEPTLSTPCARRPDPHFDDPTEFVRAADIRLGIRNDITYHYTRLSA